ncbi:MAG: gephyrin-like molybdotransferase Glp [Sphingomonadaceae bacterium]
MPTELLALEEAQARLLALAGRTPVEHVPLALAASRWLADAVAARLTQPPADVSAMDGYALRLADLPGPLRLVGQAAAGRPFAGTLAPGEAVRIFTGAHVPEGADTVAVQEEMEADGPWVRLAGEGPGGQGANIRAMGQDFRVGDPLLAAGTRLGPTALGLAAAAGHAALPVHRAPRVALLATGDELVPPGASPPPGSIVSSNGPMLAALVAAAGGEVIEEAILPDDQPLLEEAFAASAARADILVTIGGASVGDHDLVRPALVARGATIDFWRIAIRPGKPLLAGRLGEAVVLGLPGNPVSAFVCALLFLLPLLRAMAGDRAPLPEPETALAGEPLPANGPRRHFLRGRLSRDATGQLLATADARQDSSLLSVLARAECLIVRTENAAPLPAGSPVPILRL